MKRSAFVLITLVVLVVVGYAVFRSAPQKSPAVPQPVNNTGTTTPVDSSNLIPTSVSFANGKTITLNIPHGYSISVAAQGFRSARFMAWSPDHRLFLGEMASASDTSTGRVIVMDDFDPSTGTFGDVHTYLDNLRNPNSVAFYTDPQGVQWIYIALTNELIRYQYHDGDIAPSGNPQVIATFPDYGRSVAGGGWHLTRTLAFDGDTLYVSVGSSCNSCEETEPIRAVILKMNPDGSDSEIYASGLRNAVGITYTEGALYATANEVDQLGNGRPNDLVYKIQEGENYGWPYCYQYDGAIYMDTTTQWQHPYDCSKVPLAWAELPPHSAPLGITYVDGTFADPSVRNSFLVAMHGSGNPSIGNGYEVGIVREGVAPIPLINGFLQNGVRVARPVDVLMNDDQSFFLSDDFNGAIYYLKYQASSL